MLDTERERVLKLVYDRIVAYLASSPRARHVAEDLAQDVMVVLMERYGHIESEDELRNIAYQTARWKIISYLRLKDSAVSFAGVDVTEVQLPAESGNPAEAMERKEIAQRLASALREIGEPCRTLLHMFFAKKSGREMAATLMQTERAVASRLARCKRTVANIIRGEVNRKLEERNGTAN
jgi:RNA polymerase sigma-70 factor (ECF subfamily)